MVKKVFSNNSVGTIVYLHSKNGVRTLMLYHIQNLPKMNQRLKHRLQNCKLLQENIKEMLYVIGIGNVRVRFRVRVMIAWI